MDPPPSRYRVIEKDGRLIVVDTETDRPDGAGAAEPPRGRRRRRLHRPNLRLVPALVFARDWLADFVLGAAVKEWDNAGLAVVDWEWRDRRNGITFEWRARLDLDEQDRLGRALLES